ncbi:rubrerythrin-like domain-containing protein [Halorhabdus amylolytica]|uniref:rubrerythrin-like domain-containing protein n=1 Tax=Halorhabdus amylolytica TaxID=2559573 RepID=UPI0010AAFF39
MAHTHDAMGDTARTRATYVCPECGAIVTAETHPGECAMCGKPFQTHRSIQTRATAFD